MWYKRFKSGKGTEKNNADYLFFQYLCYNMKHLFTLIALSVMTVCASSCASDLSKAWKALPLNPDTNAALLEEQIAANPAQWQAVYGFLTGNDLAALAVGRHEIVPGGAYANVQEYQTKVENGFEAHRDFIDIQIVLSGEEVIGVADLADALDCTLEYDKDRDCVLYASASKVRKLDADSTSWFVFFPSDLHQPGLAKNGTPSPVKKVVVKIPVAR